MKHNILTNEVILFLNELELSLRIKDYEFTNFLKLSETAVPLLKIRWQLWT